MYRYQKRPDTGQSIKPRLALLSSAGLCVAGWRTALLTSVLRCVARYSPPRHGTEMQGKVFN
jgi:hypothetical protein